MSTAKRSAVSELNHDNWNEEEEGEEAGEFKKASEDELQRRVRKVARRSRTSDSGGAPVSNPFSGFGGFKASTATVSPTPATNSSPFSFLAKIPSAVSSTPKTNGTSEKPASQVEYLSKIKALNIAVSDWIKKCVDENPLCILTPIFTDYAKFMQEFEDHKKKRQEEEKAGAKPTEPEKKTEASSSFAFGKPSVPSSPSVSSSNSTSTNSVFNNFKFGSEPQKTPAELPSFGKPAATENKGISFGSENKGITFGTENKGISAFSSDNKGTSFGSESKGITFGASTVSSQPSAVSSTFSFGLQAAPSFGALTSTSTPFSFGTLIPPAATTAPATEDAENEEPPKNEFVPVVEDDSLYSKRCKVFVKGASDYSDRGVGTLYIKKVDESKTQMIVRADTNLGNIIFNIMLVDGLPVSRMGKNNVMVVCIPTPDAKPPPTSVLLRVKTGEEADELLAKINQHLK